ncbi:MAG: hypothetical protein P9M15_08265, partial [Candidatus Electryoneaceae bacterium]|nr:hypothetical protein [Candidatus Electryoneaceae bacterium]
ARSAGIASGHLDSLEYWQYLETDSASFDSIGWTDQVTHEIASQKDAIFWNLFGSKFVDQRLGQSFSVNYRPDILTWLGTDASYSSRYNWNWGERYGPADRSVSVNNSFSTGLTLRLPQIVTFLEDVSRRKEDDLDTGTGQFPDQNEIPLNKPMPVPGGGMPPPSGDDIPAPMDLPPPGTDLDTEPPVLLSEEEDAAVDTTKPPDQIQADSLIIKKPKRSLRARDMLVGATVILRRLQDIRWDYTFSGTVSNNSVEPGQAAWDYRLGFTKYPGLSRVSGYIATDRITRRDEHRISSGLAITSDLAISNMSYTFNQTHNQTVSQVRSESGSDSRTVWYGFESDDISIWEIPILNWSARWSGWESLPVLDKLANSVTLENGFQGRMTQQWERTANDTTRRITRTEYERRFAPLLGISFTWKGGVGSSIRYSTTETIMEGGMGTKTRNTNRSITASANYSLRKGIRIPIWPFRNKRLKNNTSFSLSYNNTLTSAETSTDKAGFEEGSRMSSWSLSPEMTYTFSSTVRGSVRYEYAVRRTKRDGETSWQDLKFSVNISIRG